MHCDSTVEVIGVVEVAQLAFPPTAMVPGEFVMSCRRNGILTAVVPTAETSPVSGGGGTDELDTTCFPHREKLPIEIYFHAIRFSFFLEGKWPLKTVQVPAGELIESSVSFPPVEFVECFHRVSSALVENSIYGTRIEMQGL